MCSAFPQRVQPFKKRQLIIPTQYLLGQALQGRLDGVQSAWGSGSACGWPSTRPIGSVSNRVVQRRRPNAALGVFPPGAHSSIHSAPRVSTSSALIDLFDLAADIRQYLVRAKKIGRRETRRRDRPARRRGEDHVERESLDPHGTSCRPGVSSAADPIFRRRALHESRIDTVWKRPMTFFSASVAATVRGSYSTMFVRVIHVTPTCCMCRSLSPVSINTCTCRNPRVVKRRSQPAKRIRCQRFLSAVWFRFPPPLFSTLLPRNR